MTNSNQSRPVLITTLLGLNCWITSVALPMWHLESVSAISPYVIVPALLALVGLALGIISLRRQGRLTVALLLVVFPLLVYLPAILQPMLLGAPMIAPAAVAVAGASFSAFLIGACWAVSTSKAKPLEAQTTPLDDQLPRKKKKLPILLLSLSGAVVLITIATAHLQSFDATELGRLRLLSTAALALWAASLFGIIAPALRHRRPWPMSAPSRGAAIVWLLVVVLGAVMLLLSMNGD